MIDPVTLAILDGRLTQIADEMDATLRGKAIQAWTRGDTLVIAGLD